MLFNHSKYKLATRLASIACSVSILCGLVSLFVLSNMDNFIYYYNYLLFDANSSYGSILMTLGLGLPGDLLESYGVDLNSFGQTMYIVTILINLLSIAQIAPCFIFAFLTRNDNKLKSFAFQKRTALHVLFIIFIVVSYLNSGSILSDCATDAPYYKVAETLDIICGFPISILFIISFFMSFNDVRMNKKIVEKLKEANYTSDEALEKSSRKINEEVNGTDRFSFDKDDYSFDAPKENKEVQVEERDFPEVKKEEEVKVDNEKLDEVYSLLAKLEKQYKNGEVSEEDYKRMKKTILDNYINK